MSNLTGIVLIAAYFFPGVYIYLLLDRTIKERENEIVTGVIRGVSASTNYRRFSLYAYWVTPVAVRLGFLLCLIAAYLVMAENLDCRSSDDFGQEAVLSKRRFMVLG